MKIKLFLAATLLLLVSNVTPASAAADWVGNGAINVNGTWYYANETLGNWCTGGAFAGADLGYINSLTLAGQCQLWDKDNEGNSVDWGQGTAYMNYTIDDGTSQQIVLTYYQFNDNNNYFQSGGSNFLTTTIALSDLALGKHTLKINFVDCDRLKPTAAVTATFTIVPWEEKGTQTEPYPISTPDDLNKLATIVNTGATFKDKYFKLTTDNLTFDNTENNFTPIGYEVDPENPSENNAFMGIFDGDGKTISGININKSVDAGLFGYIYGATIKNLTLSNSTITGNSGVGGIVGNTYISAHKIENCHVTRDVTITGTGTNTYMVGGIVGCDQAGTISNCTSAAKVSGDEAVGAIAGFVSKESTVTDCYSTSKSKAVGENGGATINISLLDNDSEATIKNATRIANYEGITCNVTLSGRTLYKKDGGWNTLCLPFNLTTTQAGTPSGLMTLSTEGTKFDSSTGELTLNFSNATSIVAGTPYIIKWSGTDVTDPTFEGVTISDAAASSISIDGVIDFVGSYGYQSFTADDNTKLLMGASSTLYYPQSGASIGAYRAYFQLDGLTAGDISKNIRAINLNFDDDTNAISTINTDVKTTGWYDLNGIKLSEEPATRGMYIHDGKKVMIK